MKKKILPILLSLVVASTMLAACGSTSASKDYETAASSEAAYAADEVGLAATEDTAAFKSYATGEVDEADNPASGGGDANETQPRATAAQSRKIQKTLSANLQTKEYDKGVVLLEEITEKYKGYYESANIEGENSDNPYSSRTAYMTIRIPADDLDTFFDEVRNSFHVVSRSESAVDVTESFYNNEARLRSLNTRIEYLEGLLENGRDLEYMFQIEREIASVMEEIDIINSQQERTKSLVSLSTVTITLSEVVEYKEVVENPTMSYSEEAGNAFNSAVRGVKGFFRGLSLFFIRNFPILIFLALIIIVAVLLIKRAVKKSNANMQVNYPQQAQAYVTPVNAPVQPVASINNTPPASNKEAPKETSSKNQNDDIKKDTNPKK